MFVNADKPHLWKKDIAASVDLFNGWFMDFAPAAYRETRLKTTESVVESLKNINDLISITPEIMSEYPSILPTLRMSTSPPLARDRLVGLAYTNKNLVQTMEQGRIPPRMAKNELYGHLKNICEVIRKLIDLDIFPWLAENRPPRNAERLRASTIVADRLCGSVADPLIRNAQEHRQFDLIADYLLGLGYRQITPSDIANIQDMHPGTFTFRLNLLAGDRTKRVHVPIDVVVQPKRIYKSKFPVLIEAKSAGDFTNTNKRRKEEATKIRDLKDAYGNDIIFILFLCGYFDSGYLGYEAAEGLDWIWEHRIKDMRKLGI